MIDGRELALANLTVLDAPPPQVVDAAAAAGFDSVTQRLAAGGTADPNPLISDTSVRRETIARLADHGIGVLDVEVVRLRADTDARALEPLLESAAALGARHLLVVGLDEDEARSAERFAAICEVADGYGIRPVLEFMLFSAVRTPEAAHRIVLAAGHPAGGVLVDPLHLSRAGGSPRDVAALAAEHPERSPYAQLCDGPRTGPPGGNRALYEEAVENRLAAGDGALPLAEMITALPERVPLSPETPVAALAGRPAAERARCAMAATRHLLEEPVP
jgi:sugar phosphate isomerase/epimerase